MRRAIILRMIVSSANYIAIIICIDTERNRRMNLDAILKLMEQAEKSSFTKVEVQSGEIRVALERVAAMQTAAQTQSEETPQRTPADPDDKSTVRAPISGVFYTAPELGAEPFVTAGARVEKGGTLCIIEAMKTMNEIRATKPCIITAVLAEDGATVAAGDGLFLLREGN